MSDYIEVDVDSTEPRPSLTFNVSSGDGFAAKGSVHRADLRCLFETGRDEDYETPIYCGATRDARGTEPRPCGHDGAREERRMVGRSDDGKDVFITFDPYSSDDEWRAMLDRAGL